MQCHAKIAKLFAVFRSGSYIHYARKCAFLDKTELKKKFWEGAYPLKINFEFFQIALARQT